MNKKIILAQTTYKMALRRKLYGYNGNETWSQQEFMNAINLNRMGKKRVRRVLRMSRNKIMEAVMLGHMLGKNNKNSPVTG